MAAKNLVCLAKSLVDLDQRIFAHSNIPMELKIAKGRRIGLGSCAPTTVYIRTISCYCLFSALLLLFFHRHPSGQRMFPDRPLPVSSNHWKLSPTVWMNSQVGFCCWGRLPLRREWWQTAKPYWGPPIERTWRTQQEGGVRLGKDSTGVEASPNQDKLRRMNKYCRLRGLNRCPLAWELGTIPLDHLGIDIWPECHACYKLEVCTKILFTRVMINSYIYFKLKKNTNGKHFFHIRRKKNMPIFPFTKYQFLPG